MECSMIIIMTWYETDIKIIKMIIKDKDQIIQIKDDLEMIYSLILQFAKIQYKYSTE